MAPGGSGSRGELRDRLGARHFLGLDRITAIRLEAY